MLLALCLCPLSDMDHKDSCAALVVVTAVACVWLVLLVTMLSRCALFDCRQPRVAWHHGALGQVCSSPVYAATCLMVQKVQAYEFVQFLNKVGDVPVVVDFLEGECKPS